MHVFHALFTHARGGLGQSHLNTTQALESKGHKVTVLMHKDSPYVEEMQKSAAVEFFQPLGFYDVLTAWRIRSRIKQLKPDVIMAHNARAITLMKCAAKGLGVPVVGVSHSYKTTRTVKADMLVLLSEHMRKHFVKAGYKGRTEVIANLIRLPGKPAPRKWHEPPVIGAIGRFTEEKGFQDLVEALNELKQMNGKFRARIGGDGPLLPELKAQAESLKLPIEFVGWVKDAPAFYAGLDILCLPSREESFPLVIIEAFAYGVPVIATDAPGPISMIEPDIDGIIVPRQDVASLARALYRMLEDKEATQNLADKGWLQAQHYDFPAIADKWDGFLQSVISTSRKSQAA